MPSKHEVAGSIPAGVAIKNRRKCGVFLRKGAETGSLFSFSVGVQFTGFFAFFCTAIRRRFVGIRRLVVVL